MILSILKFSAKNINLCLSYSLNLEDIFMFSRLMYVICCYQSSLSANETKTNIYLYFYLCSEC